jgi:hypothetical protein
MTLYIPSINITQLYHNYEEGVQEALAFLNPNGMKRFEEGMSNGESYKNYSDFIIQAHKTKEGYYRGIVLLRGGDELYRTASMDLVSEGVIYLCVRTLFPGWTVNEYYSLYVPDGVPLKKKIHFEKKG